MSVPGVAIGFLLMSVVGLSQTGPSGTAAQTTAAGAFNPRNLTGKYHRESEFQTYSNVPGGANELQAFLLGQAPAPRKLNVPAEEAPFTAAGQAAFDKNI